MPRTAFASSVFFALLVLAVASCGARTGLSTPEPCPSAGETRACADGCGPGLETCRDGAWSSCEVPAVTRACADGCGAGEESCEDGIWQGCRVPEVKRPCESVCGAGNETCRAGVWGRCDAPLPKPPKLESVVRDFSPTTHPDFEAAFQKGVDPGIVQPTLGADDKPVYAGAPRTKTTSGAPQFAQWFNDAPVNRTSSLDLQLSPSKDDAALFVYDNHAFFPIDDQLLGNEGRAHNFHFTLEASTSFQYVGGEVFSFAGDDDMWVFVNRQLVIDLGGLHQSMFEEVAIEPLEGALGLVKGNVYPLHFFFAERHTTASNFTIHTSIAEPGSCE